MAENQQQEGQQVETPGIAVPGEQVPTKVENQQPQYTAIEIQALEQGWRPKEEWEGDPEDWRDAKTYVDRGELIGKHKALSAEVKELKQMLSYMSEHNKKVYISGYQKAIQDLKAQKTAAMQDGNFEAVQQIDDAIDQHKDAISQIQRQPTVAVDDRASKKAMEDEWLAKNSWYKTESSMRHWANGMAIDYKRVNPGADDAEIYEFLTKEVKKEFPHKFKRVSGAPNPDGESSKASTTKTGDKNTGIDAQFERLMQDMPEDQARAARKIIKNVPGMTKERYLKDYGLIKGGQ